MGGRPTCYAFGHLPMRFPGPDPATIKGGRPGAAGPHFSSHLNSSAQPRRPPPFYYRRRRRARPRSHQATMGVDIEHRPLDEAASPTAVAAATNDAKTTTPARRTTRSKTGTPAASAKTDAEDEEGKNDDTEAIDNNALAAEHGSQELANVVAPAADAADPIAPTEAANADANADAAMETTVAAAATDDVKFANAPVEEPAEVIIPTEPLADAPADAVDATMDADPSSTAAAATAINASHDVAADAADADAATTPSRKRTKHHA